MKRIFNISLLSVMSLLMISCANTEMSSPQAQAIAIPLNNDLFDIGEIKLISQKEIFALSSEQQQTILAYLAQENGEHRRAIHYYNKVIDIAPYVHQAYQRLAQVYRKQGKIILARNMLKNALEWTYELTDRKAYKYKLYHLESRLPTHLKRDRKTS